MSLALALATAKTLTITAARGQASRHIARLAPIYTSRGLIPVWDQYPAGARRMLATAFVPPSQQPFRPSDPHNHPFFKDVINALAVGVIAFTGISLWARRGIRSPESWWARVLTPANKVYTMREVQKHNSARSCWVVFDGDVYDVTSYIAQHPGGSRILLQNAGKDITSVFVHSHKPGTMDKLPARCRIGSIDPLATAGGAVHHNGSGMYASDEEAMRYFSAFLYLLLSTYVF